MMPIPSRGDNEERLRVCEGAKEGHMSAVAGLCWRRVVTTREDFYRIKTGATV